jgi:aspartate racemase
MNKTKNSIGIIGGMGPFASSKLLETILEGARDQYSAKNDQDFPEIILLSLPVQNFFIDKNQVRPVLKTIKGRIKLLEKSSVCAFGIACNTAHILSEYIEKSTDLEFVSMIKETVEEVNRRNIKKVGILGSPVTIYSQLYQKELTKCKIEYVLPNTRQVNLLGKIISDLVSKRKVEENQMLLTSITRKLISRGAEGVILGCTELPLAFPEENEFEVINTTQVLANSLLKRYYTNN